MRQDGQGFALAMFFLQAGEQCLCGGIIPQEEHGGFGKGPREMGLADLAAGGARACASRFSGTLDETTGGGTILHTWESLDIMHLVEQHEAEDRADTRDRLPQIQRVGVMMRGGCDDGQFQVTQQRIVGGDQGEIDCNAFVHGRIGTALSDPVTVGFLGDLCANGRQMVLTVGIVDVGQECTTFASQRHAASEQVTGGAPLGGVDIGLREHATA